MRTVKEVSQLTGVSIRTLHHYDAIGLLPPTQVTESGYRLYDDTALQRLQSILMLRQLRFPLKEIARILDSPGFDPMEAVADQIRLLELQREQLDCLIAHARKIQRTGVFHMDFSPYDHEKEARYAAEARKKWGHTNAYRESQEKTRNRTPEQQRATGDGLMDIFAQIGVVRQDSPDSPEAQALIGQLQQYITTHYYRCTPQILKGLGQLYIAGDEMTENIDRAGGPGTADFAHRAIVIYCKTSG